MAKARNLPIHIHSGAAPVDERYRIEPSLTIIWAHAGMSEPAQTAERMMEKHVTLYADTSFRELHILSFGATHCLSQFRKTVRAKNLHEANCHP